MDYPTFRRLYDEAKRHDDTDTGFTMFAGEVGWQPWMNKYGEENAPAIISDLQIIMDLSRLDFGGIRKKINPVRNSFSIEYQIPVRTLEDWESGNRVPPDYVLRLIAYTAFLQEHREGAVEDDSE